MGFRFRKSVKIAPGLKLNISKSGISTTVGGRGASLNLSNRGVKGTVGLPGTGLSYSTNLSGSKSTRSSQGCPQSIPSDFSILIQDDGSLLFLSSNGQPYNQEISTAIKKAYKNEINHYLTEQVNHFNSLTDQIQNIKEYILRPTSEFAVLTHYQVEPFPEPIPSLQEISNRVRQDILSKEGTFSRMFNSSDIERRIDFETNRQHQRDLVNYNKRKVQWDAEEVLKRQEYEKQRGSLLKAAQGDIGAMEQFLSISLQSMDSPLNFSGSFEVECKEGIWLDIDLPEIEEIPTDIATVTKNNSVSFKKKSQKQIKTEYSMLVSGIAFIIASHVFSNLPTVEALVISGYTQRIDKSTGYEKDEYIYSLHIEKDTFQQLNLSQIDLVMALTNFNPRWNVTKSFEWKEINPYYMA